MNYFKFDIPNLIRDYKKNQNTVAALDLEIHYITANIKNPFAGTDCGDWERLLSLQRLKRQEVQMYVDMVVLGFNVIAEGDRRLLELWLIDGAEDKALCKTLSIPAAQLDKRKRAALFSFARVVSPL